MTKLLTDTALRQFKPLTKEYKKADSQGLFVLVKPNGGRYWRFNYRFNGRQKQLGFGVYPEISLAEARRKRDEVRKLLADGIDPSLHKKMEKIKAQLSQAITFRDVAEETVQRKIHEGKATATIARIRWLLRVANAALGDRPIADITTLELIPVVKAYEDNVSADAAHRLKGFMGEVFRLAIQTGRASSDPTVALKGVIRSHRKRPMPAIIEPKAFGELLRRVDGYPSLQVRYALQLLAVTFKRPGEVRLAHWSEFDLENAVWTIPEGRMKMRRPHRIPLSRQAIVILNNLKVINGGNGLLFPSTRGRDRPMSDATMIVALRALGYERGEVVPHGFRATASTLLSENGHDVDVIEAALAHIELNSVKRAYKRTDYFEERKVLMQWWADYCDGLRMATGNGAGRS